MEHIAPLIQTILWVGLVTGIVWRFHKPIDGILSALQKRIESGSSVKAGPFELTDQLRPVDLSSQKEKARQELEELLQANPGAPGPLPTAAHAASLQAKHFQAEDLALRAVQAEYGATVSRQVTAGKDMGFDGAFMTNGRLNIVEVKYVGSLGSLQGIRSSLGRLASAVSHYGWKNTQIVLVAVFERPEDVSQGMAQLQEFTAGVPIPVAIRAYGFADLQRRFGVSA